ncbi:DUF3656 domain-containing U32 family peptidase [Terrisporobacter sp.]
MKDVELLAPVGSFESLKAAVQNGANAVYLGGKDFSARASANNFDRDELREAVKYAHTRGVRVFVTTNTLIKQNELESFIEYVKFLYDINIDALILQDIGAAMTIKKLLPDFELHASTQMVAHSLEDVKYLEGLGFDRVVLARELNVDEIKHICDNTNVDIEVFVHGALCVCYSGQCLMSSMIGNRSGNRGRCAQPCRQRYTMVDIYTGEEVESNGDYLLSTRDLNSIEEINKVIDAGVYSLKIEGRMKKPEYVATVIGNYREAIDEYLETNKVNISHDTMADLYTIFNRKFTKGLLLGEVGKDVMNSQVPNNQGLYIGRVVDYNKKVKRLKIALEENLKKGDGINLGGGVIGRIIKGKEISEIGYRGETIEIDFIGEARKNQMVFKTSDTKLIDKAQSTFKQDKELAKSFIDGEISIKLNENPVIKFKDLQGNESTVVGDFIVEKALKVPVSKEKIETQLRKLGNTPYELRNLHINLEDGVSLPISVINQMRRECIDILNEERIPIKDRKYKDTKAVYNPKKVDRNKDTKIRVKVKNLEQLQVVLDFNIDVIYYEEVSTFEQALEMADKLNKKLIYSAPRIIRNKEFKRLNKIKDLNLSDIQIGTLGSIDFFENKNFHIDYYLNAFNSETINHFKSEGATSVCISQELNMSEIEETLCYTDMDIESVVYGYTPMMITEYCPMGVVVRDCKKNKRCEICNESKYALRDFKGEEYRLSQDIFCRTTIYNSKPICILDNLDELSNSGVNIFRLDFTGEKEIEVREVMEAYMEVMDNNFRLGKKSTKFYNKLDEKGLTTGHFYKGVE